MDDELPALWTKFGWVAHTQLMLDSFRRWLGRDLVERTGTPEDQAKRLFEAPFVVVSHGTQSDPILNYGNHTALKLWEMAPATLLSTPSRLTAEPIHRDERALLLEKTTRDGYSEDYSGIRVSRTGRRFQIHRAVVWNLVDGQGVRLGQAATFSDWTPLEAQTPGDCG